MNDFRNKEPSNKFRRSASLDGISGRPTPKFNQPGARKVGFSTPTGEVAGHAKKLDGFSRPDGFHSTKQQQIRPLQPRQPERPAGHARVAEEPLLIERPTTKRSFMGRGKNKRSGLDGAGRRKKPLSRKKKIFRVVAVLVVLVALITGFLFAKGYLNLRKVLSGGGGAAALQDNVDPSRLKGEGDGRVNVMLLGRGGAGHDGADLTDTIIIASIDPIAKEATLVSLPRDFYVPVSGNGSMKINSVFYTGKTASLNKQRRQTDEAKKQADEAGFALLESTIEKNFGIPIHYHAMVDFSGFKQAIDTVGGIDINAPAAVVEQMRIDGKPYKLDVKPGQQHMDGFKALAYSRSRYTSARGDFDRSERQRLIIVALKDKVFSLGTFGNPQKISQLLGNFGNHVQTNFSVQDLKRLYDLSKDISGTKVTSVGLADPPNNYIKTANIGGLSVVVPTAGVGDFTEIKNYLRSTLKDSYLRSENASVLVLNGTQTAGIGSKKADELKSYGYNVVGVENAPTKNYAKTVVVDLRNGSKKYTKNYLEKRYGVSAVTTLPDPTIQAGTADFVIIIGNDQNSR
jgi:polyisoprenyl-teichoic acid--peptidoglycan teichoic acid transferase